ncbi:MAG: hypothetical protein WED10_11015 [Brumimicrobium sp.]
MQNKELHIISFDVPYPPNYGGAFDVFHRIKALHNDGYKITLHCFDYGRGKAAELNEITNKVIYYQRKNKLLSAVKKTPLIVSSRENDKLLTNLLKNSYPILFEGQHSTAFLNHALLRNRTKLVRIHNIEHEYYQGLFSSENNPFRKQYFKNASRRLKKHEKELSAAQHLLCITEKDTQYYHEKFGTAFYLPVALPFNFSKKSTKIEDYVLFHGNLSVPENESAVLWILEKLASKTKSKLIIAGQSPSNLLIKRIESYDNVSLYSDVSEQKMAQLKAKAKIHLLITFQSTGIKLKLLNSLCERGTVICNSTMVEGTNLSKFTVICNQPEAFLNAIENEELKPVNEKEIEERHNFLKQNYSYDLHVDVINKILRLSSGKLP